MGGGKEATRYHYTPIRKAKIQNLDNIPGSSVVKNLPANAGDIGSIPGSGSSHGVGNGNPLQYSCLKNHMDRGAWQAAVHGVAKSWAGLNTHTHADRYW